jgi:glutamine synthetase
MRPAATFLQRKAAADGGRNCCTRLADWPAPWVNRCWSSPAPTWGVNNRSVALRVPAGPVKARRIEHRPSGVDANPYLVAATVLAGIRHGLENAIDPGPETTGNGYEAEASDVALPHDWGSAIRAATSSVFLRDALGADMHRTFCAIKAAEHLRVSRTIPDVDFQLYLHEV